MQFKLGSLWSDFINFDLNQPYDTEEKRDQDLHGQFLFQPW